MDELIEKYLKRVKGLKSEGTYRSRRSTLGDFDSWVEEQGFEDITELDALDLEEYFIHLNNQGFARNTIESRYDSVRGFYKYLTEKMNLYEDSPFDDLTRSDYLNGSKSKKVGTDSIVYVTPEEVELLCENAPPPTLRNELTFRLLFQTGMRAGEVVNVTVDDVDREERAIRVQDSKDPDKTRTVYYQPSLDLLMDQWLVGGHRSSYTKADSLDHLLITRRGPLKEAYLRELVRETADEAGIQEVLYEDAAGNNRHRVTTHAFRHGHAVRALKSGIDVRTVQKHLGHENVEMTMKYLQLIDDDVKEGYRRFNPRSEA